MGNLLSAIGRSQAIPQFIEQARLARKDELAAGMAQEHLNLAKSADARAQIASEGQNAMTEEQLKALRFESQKKQEEEAFLTNPTDMKTFLQSNTPNQSVATVAEEYLRANGLVDNIGGGDVINRKNYNRFIEDAQKNPMVQNNINDANLKSARTYLSTVQAAINGDKDAMNTLKQKDPKFNEKMLPEAEKDAQMNLDQALLSSQHLTKFQAEEIRVKELAANKEGKETAYGQFASGFRSQYLKTHPNATEGEIDMATAQEAKKQNIEKGISITVGREDAKNRLQGGLLTPEALNIEGIRFATTGKMTAMGMSGGPVLRAKIMNAASEYLISQGIKPTDVPAMQAEYKATTDAYNKVKTPLEQIKGFESGMIKNADFALQLSKENYRTQIPPVNVVLNAIKTKTGDPKIVKFGTAIYAVAMEFEKIRTAGTNITSAELSVGAQQKAEEILNKAQTPQQLEAVISAMKTDAKNITSARRGVLDDLSTEMRTLGGAFANNNTAPSAQTTKLPTGLKSGW